MVKTVALIQARTRSYRFERKVLKEISGLPVFSIVFERVRKVLEDVYFVIPKGDSDLRVALMKYGYPFFEGDEEDVLSRYFLAVEQLGLQDEDVVFRVTSDNPFVCPGVIKKTLRAALKSDYTASSFLEGFTLGIGVEAFRVALLREANKKAEEKYQREHVTPYIRENAPRKVFPKPAWYEALPLRLTLDYYEDYLFMNLLVQTMGVSPLNLTMKALGKFLRSNPFFIDYSRRIFASVFKGSAF